GDRAKAESGPLRRRRRQEQSRPSEPAPWPRRFRWTEGRFHAIARPGQRHVRAWFRRKTVASHGARAARETRDRPETPRARRYSRETVPVLEWRWANPRA